MFLRKTSCKIGIVISKIFFTALSHSLALECCGFSTVSCWFVIKGKKKKRVLVFMKCLFQENNCIKKYTIQLNRNHKARSYLLHFSQSVFIVKYTLYVSWLTVRKISLRSFNVKEIDFKNFGALTALYIILFSNCWILH